MACIAGGIAEAYYDGIPEPIRQQVLPYLDKAFIAVIDAFGDKCGCSEVSGG